MADFSTRGQLASLAQLLGVEHGELDSLSRLGAGALHTLHDHISAALFDTHQQTFARVARLAPLVPDALAARVALAVVPPEVSGRAGGALGIAFPNRIAGVLAGLTPEYMADAACYLDPRAIAVLAARIAPETLIPAAQVLVARGDYVTAARFIEFATEQMIKAFAQAFTDDVALLHIAALTHSTQRLNEILQAVPAQRLEAVVRAAAATDDDTALLCATSVLARLNLELRRRLTAELLAALGRAGSVRLITVAVENQAAAELLTALCSLPDSERATLAELTSDTTLSDQALRIVSVAVEFVPAEVWLA